MEKQFTVKMSELEFEQVVLCVKYVAKEYECTLCKLEAEYEKLNYQSDYYDTAIGDTKDRMRHYDELVNKLKSKEVR